MQRVSLPEPAPLERVQPIRCDGGEAQDGAGVGGSPQAMNTPLVVWMTGFTAALALMAPVFAVRILPSDRIHFIAALLLAAVWPFLFLAVIYVLWIENRK